MKGILECSYSNIPHGGISASGQDGVTFIFFIRNTKEVHGRLALKVFDIRQPVAEMTDIHSDCLSFSLKFSEQCSDVN